jgi:hypothetical protein
MANEIVGELVASNPQIANWVDLNFIMQPGYQDGAWRDAFWSSLTPFTISKVSVLGVHVYPTTLDPIETRSFLRNTIIPWRNSRGLNNLPLLLHETGFDAAVRTQEQCAQYMNDFAVAFQGVNWLDGVNWFLWNDYPEGNYVTLSNPQQTKLKKAGVTYAQL